MAAQTCAGFQSSGKRSTCPPDQPCSTTSRGSRHSAPHTPRPKACQKTSLPSCANRTHDTSASKGLPCPEVQHLTPDHRLFLRHVARASLRHSSCWLSCAFPRQPRGPEKATFFSTQKGPSQAVCRLFTLAPLTVIRPRTGAESAKKHVNPNVSTLTGSNKFTLIPLQTFQRLRWSSHWTFQVFFRHAQAGSGGFFPECFFDELGDKICLLHLLLLSWLTKDSPFDSMCRLFFFVLTAWCSSLRW